jgi:hypothetical protein
MYVVADYIEVIADGLRHPFSPLLAVTAYAMNPRTALTLYATGTKNTQLV